MNDDQLINKKYLILQRNKILYDSEKFIYNEIATRINDSLEGLNLNINNCLELGLTSKNIYKYMANRFLNINFTALDISNKLLSDSSEGFKKICIDHDKWNPYHNEFDIILSNLYLHLSNNLEHIFKKIYNSLKNNGFFISTIPGKNCLFELKEAMLYTDLKLYGGAYRRFDEKNSISSVSHLLKKSNFKSTLIDIDTINLHFNDFQKLLIDVRNLGSSYFFYDKKKKFENKKYFKEVEKFYWKKFSNKGKLILSFEIIFFSGWKN